MIQVLLMLVVLLGAGRVAAMDLMDIYREARLNDARYAAARAQFRAEQERVPQARAGLRPKLTGGVAIHNHGSGPPNDALAVNTGQRHYEAYDNGIGVPRSLHRLQGNGSRTTRGRTW